MPMPSRKVLHAAWRERIGPVWKSRMAAGLGAVLVGLFAWGFALAADHAQLAFNRFSGAWPYAPLIVSPLGFLALAWLTRIAAPEARGSGIPQVIAAARDPAGASRRGLTSLRTAVFKLAATLIALLVGGSVGREGPTVQVGAAIMAAIHRVLRIPVTSAVIIAGGAAGVAAAFNTPIAGVAFALEELAAAYEQRLTLLVMAAVMIAGLVPLSLAGDYIYFGVVAEAMPAVRALPAALLVGALGGAAGGLFSRISLKFLARGFLIGRRPLITALVCGAIVGVIGVASHGLTWGTGYDAARTLVEGGRQPLWFAPAKFVATLASSLSGAPGGVFAPSLSVGAGLGGLMANLFPEESRSAIVLIGMIAYFVGVVRAPLTGVVIIAEMTANRGMILPLFAAAVIADVAAKAVSGRRLYHGLADRYRAGEPEKTAETDTEKAPGTAPGA
ncbi:MAG: chloride channel protein [Alphaproteobacteria bacterium]|nr:chloride channel protein [Alphaproteobacteria bacterium]MBU2377828.1 chloride channel protein [Alphaproteobacteria bacterium]